MGKKRRFAQVGSERIPLHEDAATVLYLADENGDWPREPLNYLRADLDWIREGEVLELENLDPGSGDMGRVATVAVIRVETRIQTHRGKYGQVIRRVLLQPVESGEALDRMTAAELRLRRGGTP